MANKLTRYCNDSAMTSITMTNEKNEIQISQLLKLTKNANSLEFSEYQAFTHWKSNHTKFQLKF